MLDHVPWFARFHKLYVFSKGLPSPLVHPLRGIAQSNITRWLDKGSNNRQWLATLWMIQEEGSMLFARGVKSLVGEGWQSQAISAYEELYSSTKWKMEFKERMHHVQL